MAIDPTIQTLLDAVPDYQTFLTVDEMHANSHQLASDYPDIVEIVPLGHSRAGQAIEALKIGSGSKTGFMVGLPHPNEPIGAMMLEFLTRQLAEDDALRESLDYTWYIIKAIDPDGTRLNQGWFKGPFTITNYARNFYRPPGVQQIEWTFPIDYKTYSFHEPLPETRAYMKLIDIYPPDFIFSLHNAGFGGVYLYLSHDLPEMYPPFFEVVEHTNLPLHLGEPEVPYATQYEKAVFGMIGLGNAYDFLEKTLERDPAEVLSAGASSYEYAARNGDPLFLVCEMPYFYNAAINDLSQSDVVRRDAVIKGIAVQRQMWAFIESTLKKLSGELTVSSPFKDATELNVKNIASYMDSTENYARTNPDFENYATVAEAFDSAYGRRFYTFLSLGMVVRMIETQIEHGGTTPKLEETLAEAEHAFNEEATYLEDGIDYSVIPIKKLVQVQLASALLALRSHTN